MTKYVVVPTETAQRYDRLRERKRLEKARARKEGRAKDRRTSHHGDAPFIAWDGEAPKDVGYCLFGNSIGDELCKRAVLGTVECLELLLNCKRNNPDTIHIWFGGNYDVSNILKDLSWRHFSALHKFTRTIWKDYEIQHIPHKWLQVKKDGITIRVFDVHSFFASSYVDALDAFRIGTSEERNLIREEKKNRPHFVWADMDTIKKYWRLELRLMPLLMEKLRTAFRDAGYVPRSWHGPGALARMALQKHKVYSTMAECPPLVKLAAQYAFAAGRFELFQAGHIREELTVVDINSAYPYFATFLPNLNRGHWRRGRNYESGKFAVYRIRYISRPPNEHRPYPLFRRLKDGSVVWPHRVEGWYWAPEAELVKDDKDARFLEAWIFDEDDPTDRPFAFLTEYYRRRKLLKGMGNAAEYTFKLLINAIYGQLAQRAGWNRKNRTSPKSHQLEWAGCITSACRAAIYRAANSLPSGSLVSIDTDGITATTSFDIVNIGSNLGEWSCKTYTEGIFWQSGIYCLNSGKGWDNAKTRGIPKGTYTASDLLQAIAVDKPLRLTKNTFVTYGLADIGNHDKINTWVSEPHEYVLGGEGKRVHVKRGCKLNCDGERHHLLSLQIRYGPEGSAVSIPHYLPWLDNTEKELLDMKGVMDDQTLFNVDDLDEDERWVVNYAR